LLLAVFTGAGLARRGKPRNPGTIAHWTGQRRSGAASFMARDLSGVDYVYLWVDGILLGIRLEEDKRKTSCACW